MIRWRSQSVAPTCWKCQWQIANHQRPRLVYYDAQRIQTSPKLPRRALHAATTRAQEYFEKPSSPIAVDQLRVWKHLRQWDLEFGGPGEAELNAFGNYPKNGEVVNTISKFGKSKGNGDALEDEQSLEELDENDQGYEDLVTLAIFMKPGDLVELHPPNSEPILGVVVQTFGPRCNIYLANGRRSTAQMSTIKFVLQGYMDPALLEPLNPFLPTDPEKVISRDTIQIPPEVGSPILTILDQLQNEADSTYRQNSSVLDNAYSTLAYRDRARTMTLEQVVKALLSPNNPNWHPPFPALLAVRKALSHNEFRVRPDRTHHRITHIYHIRSKSDVSNVEKVLEWVRDYKEYRARVSKAYVLSGQTKPTEGYNHINDFIHKARRLICASRKIRTPQLGSIGPSKGQPLSLEASSELSLTFDTETFTETDKHIIDFFQAWVLKQQFFNAPALLSACTTILGAIGEYHGGELNMSGDHLKEMKLNQSTGQLFLQEIGVIGPHDNRAFYDEELMLPMAGMSHNMELLKAKAELALRNPNFVDAMSDLRRDWGSMIVWCIDDQSAQEIDDGISVERVEGAEGEYWVHAHIANPTAFFNKSHVVSGLAAHMSQSVYTPGFALPMVPKWLSLDYFSLEPNRPTITFSSRIDKLGNILETKIQHGIARNVQKVTYSDVCEYLGEKDMFEPQSDGLHFTVGESTLENSPHQLPVRTKEELENLQDLYTVAKAAFSARQRGGADSLSFPGKNLVRVSQTPQTPGLPWLPPSTDSARFVHGDPTIDITSGSSGRVVVEDINSTNIVEEIMVLTGRSAASWCAERGIPVIFSGTLQNPLPEEALSVEEYRRQVLAPQMQELGYISPAVGLRYSYYLGRGITHYAPIPHEILGLPAYTKVTSPLRRFSDMIAHWQIEAAIRYEARTGRKLDPATISKPSESPLPFSPAQLKQAMLTLIPRETNLRQIQKASSDFWVVQAFMRAFHCKEATLPETFRVWIHTTVTNPIRGFFTGFQFKTMVKPKEPNADIREGDQWECKIMFVNVFLREITVEPIRLLYRQPDPVLN
ncbi:RNB-domain-containing protein [Periconia macrospinosa]|uniref:RNB-domain-containing protein n=1 Tax=Periconia macrospinosa TaxID=97972 RepID=A0A2V1D8E1_9PLEO|nr:RNB-domain-containing protein [Periconia macrospinosa]